MNCTLKGFADVNMLCVDSLIGCGLGRVPGGTPGLPRARHEEQDADSEGPGPSKPPLRLELRRSQRFCRAFWLMIFIRHEF